MNLKNCFLLFLVLTFFNGISYAQGIDKKFKVVIDAGHGGDDPGALGKKCKEKDITLAVALKLGKLITDNNEDVQVIYTRSSDATVEVFKRAVVANKNHADLFISIHCNAATDRAAHGVETFLMGVGKTEANLEVARKENAAILLEKNFENNYEGFNPNSPEASIIFSLYTSAYMKNSVILADKVQRNLVKNTHLFDRSVKQAGFWVLYKVAMPSILIELGFVSNAKEEEYLMKDQSQIVMASSIYNSFVEYRNKLNGTNNKTIDINSLTQDLPNEQPQKDHVADTPNEPEKVLLKTEVTTTPDSEKKTTHGEDKNNIPTNDDNKKLETSNQSITYRIQIAALPDDISLSDHRFSKVSNLKKFYENKMWKYTSGNETSFNNAQKLLIEVKKYFPDAFIVAFDKDVKIPVSKARELLHQ